MREDCIKRNILYESECTVCVLGVGEAGDSLEMTGATPALYVGESARSLYERTGEHWLATEQKKEESHMYQHVVEAHNGESKPSFNFKVVRTFKTALDRQVGEAIRIEMRGSVLNRRGEFNRCSLTRLGVDQKWEDERWKKSWESLSSMEDVLPVLYETQKARRPDGEEDRRAVKRLKLEANGVVWGEELSCEQLLIAKFMVPGAEECQASKKQSTLPVLTGNHWMAYTLAKEIAWQAVDRAWSLAGVEDWDDWSPDEFVMNGKDEMLDVVVMAGQSHGCGTAQKNIQIISNSTPLTLKEGGGEGAENKKRGRKKKQLPGVSAKQKSVRDFFSVRNSVSQKCLPSPSQELGDVRGVMAGCDVSCDNIVVSEECEQTVAKLNERKYTPKMCQRGGEEKNNSDKLKGGPVAEIRSIFLQDGVGGASKINNNNETLAKDNSQNWRQKLAKFKP